MSDFNYEKAYFVQALPAFQNLTQVVQDVHSKLIPLVGELAQNSKLNIPLSPTITELLESLSTKQLAEMSRASYFVGHWCPSRIEIPFNNQRGESWKVANCCDQILRKRLDLPYNIQIHEGKLRVTFSNKYCWIWEEFGLATEENLQIFNNCNLPFGENTLDKSAKILKEQIGDLWPDIETELTNSEYSAYQIAKTKKEDEKLRKQIADLIPEAKQKAQLLIAEAELKTTAHTWLMDHGYKDLFNVIYYPHTQKFCFGWNKPIQDKPALLAIIKEFPFPYEVK